MRIWLGLVFAAGCSGPAPAQTAQERIAQTPLDGFEVAHRAQNDVQSLEEWVPRGETVERWTRMVTIQRYSHSMGLGSPQTYLEQLAREVAQACPGLGASPVESITVSGRPGARLLAECPRNPTTGLPETFFAMAIAGTANLHGVQFAFRRTPTASDLDWAASQLESVVLCTARSREPVCRR